MQKLIDVSVNPNVYYEIKSIVRADVAGPKHGYIATYRGDYHIVSLEEIVITVQDFWSTITWYIKVEDADRLVLRLGDVELLNSRVSYLANDGSWRLHTAFYP
jgi:hypothetical protein